MMNKGTWLRIILIGGVMVLAASFGFSRALRANAARRYLIARLTASFGRPVDVSWFDFSMLDGARIEAHSVTVSEDPHFGGEYFLRAETLTAGLRWTALFAGRFEFGSVSLSRPSLNLTRDAEGHWNIERWLPPAPPPPSSVVARPGFVGPMAPSSDVRAARPYRIDVDGGRINFKQGDIKSPFALADVSGNVQEDGTGRWQLDLEARPMRAGVELQDIGTLRLRGSLAGTTARLQPAELNLTWRSGSLADALRLVRQNDYGMRGQLAVDLNARIAPQNASSDRDTDSGGALWSISAVARLTRMHGWKLPEHASDPAANLSVQMTWRIGERRAEIRRLLVELPASHLQAIGDWDWVRGLRPQMHIDSSTLALNDVLSWYRALQPGVAEGLRAEGTLGLDLKLGGWPMEFQQGGITGAGGTLTAPSLPAALQMGGLKATVVHGGFDIMPTAIFFARKVSDTPAGDVPGGSELANSFTVRGALIPRASGVFRWPPDWNFSIEGATPQVQDWLAVSAALAQPINSDWSAKGALSVKMRGAHFAAWPDEQRTGPWLGTMDFAGLTLSPAYVNQSVRIPKAHVDFGPLERNITLSAAEAFGAIWHGTAVRKYPDGQWTFDLSADHLDAAELDRWLGPRARPGFLARFAGLSSRVAPTPIADPVVARLAAHGRFRAATIDIPPMHLEQFDGDAEVAGREIRIRKATANLFAGRISGTLDARLLPDPSYEFEGRVDRVDLAQLASAVPFLDGRMRGNASGALELSAHGIGRQSLIGSMQGQGTINAKNVELRGIDLSTVFPGDPAEGEPGMFSSVQGTYRIRAGEIDLANFVMDNSRGRLEAEGRIDFSHTLNIRVRPSIFQAATAPASASPTSFLLSGTIEAPKLIVPSASPKARTNSR